MRVLDAKYVNDRGLLMIAKNNTYPFNSYNIQSVLDSDVNYGRLQN